MCSVWNEKKQNISVYIYFLEKFACVCPKSRYGNAVSSAAGTTRAGSCEVTGITLVP